MLAHGASVSFQLALAFAAVALVVSLVGVKAKASDIDTAAVASMRA